MEWASSLRRIGTSRKEAGGCLRILRSTRSSRPTAAVHKALHPIKGDVPEGEYLVPFGQARIVEAGDDVTSVAYGRAVQQDRPPSAPGSPPRAPACPGRREREVGGRWAGAAQARPRASVAILLLSAVGAYALSGESRLAVALAAGAGFGLAIERGRICFTAAFRDLWITRQSPLARALALAMAVASIGFAVAVAAGVAPKSEPAGLNALLGGAIFGVGILVAGGCETGWMYRASQGYVQLWMAGLGTFVGTIVLAWAWEAWGLYALLVRPFRPVNVAAEIGLPVALGLTLVGLGAWWAFARLRDPSAGGFVGLRGVPRLGVREG
jgi:uncharacterized membrane protein YedE/YeeE